MLRAISAAVLLNLLAVSGAAGTSVAGFPGPEVLPELGPSLEKTVSLELSLAAALAPKTAATNVREPLGGAPEPTIEPVELTTSDGVRILARFYVPEQSEDRAPAVLVVHDAGESGAQLDPIAEYLNRRGFGVLVLDLRGHGMSATAELDWTKLDDEAKERTWARALDDVQAGAEWLRKREDIHASNLTLLGVGAGCALAARHAVNDENARAAVLVGPRASSLGFNLMRDLTSLGGLPTLILTEKTGKNDAVRMIEASHSANGGQEYIQAQFMRCKPEKLVTDSKLKSNLGSWLRDQVMPRRGR